MVDIDKTKMRIGDIIVQKGYVTSVQMQEAFRQQKATGLRLGEQLLQMGLITEDNILECLCWQNDVPMMSLAGVEVSPSAYRKLSEDYIEQSHVLPVDLQDGQITVVHSDPLNLSFIADEVSHKSGCKVQIFAATEASIKEAIKLYKDRMREFVPLLQALQAESPDQKPVHIESSYDLSEASTPMIAFANMIIRTGIKRKATDIFVRAIHERLQVLYRVDGLITELLKFPADLDLHKDKIVARMKTMAELDISDKRLPQDGKFRASLEQKEFDCRLSVMPTVFGEKVVIRILYKDRLDVSLDKTGLSNYSYRLLTQLLKRPHGLMLVTGPTGSGKTTTLYASLAYAWDPGKSVVTVEDPVEYVVEQYAQSQVNPDIGLTFASLLRTILRQSPDVILVGEIRDAETAQIGCEAAMTGHLVLSTLHSNDAPSSVMRMTEIGVDRFLVASVLLGSLAQRLVRSLCAKCRLRVALNKELQAFSERYKLKSEFVYRAKGCSACMGSGYVGRLGLHELLQVTSPIADIICANGTPGEIRTEARKKGFITIREDALLKVIKGQTDMEQVAKATA
jgi:type IV pilus assembly protein PilB